MARENQGLQIALIVFVIFTIVFAVLTFIFSKDYSKAKAMADDAETKASEASAAQKAAEADLLLLKQQMGGYDTATTMQTVTEQFNTDMLTFAKNLNDASPDYRKVCQWLFDEVQRKNEALSAEKERVQDLKDYTDKLKVASDAQIKQFRDEAEKARTDLEAETAKFQQSQLSLKNAYTKLEATKNQVVQQFQTEKQQSDATIGGLKKELTDKQKYIVNLQQMINDLDPPFVENPDGEVVYSSRGGKVTINLGRVHGLQPLTNFAVYDRNMTDLTTSARKGAIEVIDVRDETSVCQIIEDDISNPILQGDKVFTPLWKPGERQHFAITDGIDLDHDGRSDVDELVNLIRSKGGEVDLWLDDEGQKYGNITADTKYLIIGKQPTEGSSTARLNARKWILDEAKNYNLQRLSLDEVLNRMGYVRKVHVVRYDSKSNPTDFRARPPEGVPRVSSGTVSDLYRKEAPPKPVIDSAY